MSHENEQRHSDQKLDDRPLQGIGAAFLAMNRERKYHRFGCMLTVVLPGVLFLVFPDLFSGTGWSAADWRKAFGLIMLAGGVIGALFPFRGDLRRFFEHLDEVLDAKTCGSCGNRANPNDQKCRHCGSLLTE